MILTHVLAAAALQMQSAAAAPPPQAPYSELLSSEYAERDYDELARLLFSFENGEQLMASLDWLGANFRSDGSTFVSHAYAKMLIAVAANMEGEQAVDLQTTALMAMTHAVLTAQIDALQCADTTALGIKARELAGELQATGLHELPQAQREMAAMVVMQIEESTWPVRREANHAAYLCTGGMAAMIAGLGEGTQQERDPRKGEIGRQVEVTPPAAFVYERRDNADWIKDAEILRERRGEVVKLLLAVERIPSLDELQR